MSGLAVRPSLHRVGDQLSRSAGSVRLDSELLRPADAVLGSSVVTTALSAGVTQQARRAELTAASLQSLGTMVTSAIAAYENADAQQARHLG